MADDVNTTPDKYEARLNQAVADLRHNVRWTLIAFGAIGTTLLAGSQLSNLGAFQWDDARLWIALGSALLALLSAACAVRATLLVAFAGYTEFYNLRKEDITYVEENRAMLEGFESIDDLRKAYDKCIKERHAALTAQEKNAAAIDHYEVWFTYLDALVDRILSYIRYNRIRQQSKVSGRQLFVASIVAAVSLVVFAWAANPKNDQPKTVLSGPPFAATY